MSGRLIPFRSVRSAPQLACTFGLAVTTNAISSI